MEKFLNPLTICFLIKNKLVMPPSYKTKAILSLYLILISQKHFQLTKNTCIFFIFRIK